MHVPPLKTELFDVGWSLWKSLLGSTVKYSYYLLHRNLWRILTYTQDDGSDTEDLLKDLPNKERSHDAWYYFSTSLFYNDYLNFDNPYLSSMIALSILSFSYLEHPILPIGLLYNQNQSGDSGFLKSTQPGGKTPLTKSLIQDPQCVSTQPKHFLW